MGPGATLSWLAFRITNEHPPLQRHVLVMVYLEGPVFHGQIPHFGPGAYMPPRRQQRVFGARGGVAHVGPGDLRNFDEFPFKALPAAEAREAPLGGGFEVSFGASEKQETQKLDNNPDVFLRGRWHLGCVLLELVPLNVFWHSQRKPNGIDTTNGPCKTLASLPGVPVELVLFIFRARSKVLLLAYQVLG